MAGIRDFIAEVGKKGVSRSNLFEVQVIFPQILSRSADLRTLSFYCNAAHIPSINLQTNTILEDYIPHQVPFSASYDELQLSFVMDVNLEIRKVFEAWHNIVYNHEHRMMSYYDDFVGTIVITTLTRELFPTYTVIINEVFPRNIGGIQYAREAGESLAVLPVSFPFRTLQSNTLNSSSIIQNLGSVFGGNILSTVGALVSTQSDKFGNILEGLSTVNRLVSLTSDFNVLSPTDKATVSAADAVRITADTRSQINPWADTKLISYSANKVS